MAQYTHETLAAAGSVVSPATTRVQLEGQGCVYALMSTTADIRFTIDGATAPVVTASSEVGTLLRSTDLGIVLTIDEFLALKILDVSTDARVQFEFMNEKFRNGPWQS